MVGPRERAKWVRFLVSAVVAVVAAVVLACGSSSPAAGASKGSGSMSATIGGKPFVFGDAFSEVITLPNSGTPPATEVAVAITNYASACASFGSTLASSDAVISIIVLGTTPMAYPINGADVSVEYLSQWDSMCHTYTWTTPTGGGSLSTHAAVFEEASSGTVTLTSVTSTSVVGSFDATFPSGDHVIGTFTAPNCTPPAGGGSSLTC